MASGPLMLSEEVPSRIDEGQRPDQAISLDEAISTVRVFVQRRFPVPPQPALRLCAYGIRLLTVCTFFGGISLALPREMPENFHGAYAYSNVT